MTDQERRQRAILVRTPASGTFDFVAMMHSHGR